MLKRRKQQEILPLTSPRNNSLVDGSGKAVKMDIPIVKAAKNASYFTKCTYIVFIGSLLLAWFSFRYLTYHYGMLHLVVFCLFVCFIFY